MNRQVPVAMCERVRVIVKTDLEAHLGVVIRCSRDVALFEYWLKSAHLPASAVRVHLMGFVSRGESEAAP